MRLTGNGTVKIDHSLAGNRIRAVVLRLKNDLFAGSHTMFRQGGIISAPYPDVIQCESRGETLEDVLRRIGKMSGPELHRCSPYNWKVEREATLSKIAWPSVCVQMSSEFPISRQEDGQNAPDPVSIPRTAGLHNLFKKISFIRTSSTEK